MTTSKESLENQSFPVYVDIQFVEDLQQQHNNENYELAMRMELMEGQMSRFHNDWIVRMDRTDQVLTKLTKWQKQQAGVNDWLTNQVSELREIRLRQETYYSRELMKKSDNTSVGTASNEQSQQQQRWLKWDRTAFGPGSRRNVPTHSGAQSEKRPCPLCGKILSAKYLRKGGHQKSKRCLKAAADAAALLEQAPESPDVTYNVRTVDGDLLYCSEEEDDIPGDLLVEIE